MRVEKQHRKKRMVMLETRKKGVKSQARRGTKGETVQIQKRRLENNYNLDSGEENDGEGRGHQKKNNHHIKETLATVVK